MAQVSYGTITITDTNDINRIYVEYCRSISNQLSGTTVPNITRAWGETTPPWVDGEYIWQRAVVEKSGTLEKTYGTPVCISGEKGETGQQGPQGGTGAAGRSLKSTKTQYTTAAANATITQSNMGSYTWSDNVPTYNANAPAYWVRITNTYENPTETLYIIYKDNGITDAVKTSADANATASAANTTAGEAKTQAAAADGKADTAIGTANTANTNATNALNIATGINQHFWTISTDYATGVPAGSYITDTAIDTFKSNKTGGNLLTRSDGIWIRNGVNTLTSLTGTALTFYNPTDNKAQLIIGANGILQSGNFVYTSGTYSDSGTKIDLTNGSIYTPGFRTDGSNTYIRGEINALTGKIGNNSTNYWTIGNNYNYDQTASAALISHGTAFIQLNESNTWRLSTDRIHTAWNGTDGSAALMFPKDGNTYWDWGIHSPHQTNNVWKDKFVYARKYTNTTDDDFTNRDNLSNDIDDDLGLWTYQFYIDKNGSVYARNFYLLNEDGTPGSNIGGQDAVYLLKSGGTMTGSITMSNGGKFIGDLTGNADTASNAAKVNGLTVQTAVPANAVFTDKNVQTSQANATKLYLVGTSSTGTSTSTLNFDSNIYADTTAGALHATTYNGYTLAAASAKGVDTSMPTTVTDNNVPTTKLMKSFVEGKRYITSEADPIFVASAAHGITSTDISNWNSKTSNTGTVTSVRVQASSPLTSTTSTASSTTLDTTIKFANQNKNLVLAGPLSGNAAAPTFRSLVADDIPGLAWSKITSGKPTTLSGYGITDAAGSNALVGLSAKSNDAGVTTFTATRASGQDPLSFEVSIVASAAAGANALRDSEGPISKGSVTKPVYFSNGVPAEANTYAGGTAVILNNASKASSTASFYAPTSGGTTTQVLVGNGTTSAPTWKAISDIVPSKASTADAFSSAATVKLTGDTTGSASSTKGWSITTKTDRISTVGDNRAVATTPNDYVNKIIFQGLKTNSSFGTPSTDTYSYVVGLRGWSGSSGGNSHEFAFNNSGINHRSGATTSWGAWEKLVTSANYTDYTVTKTGTGASGTWGISISGTAAKATADASGNTITSTYVKKAGDTMTGALNTANGTANKIGDDSQLGDFNVAGTLGIQGLNGTTGVALLQKGTTWGATGNYAHITYDGTYIKANKLLQITANSNTVVIGSQNNSFTHIYNSASIPFIFNNSVLTTSGDLGNNTYAFNNLYMKGGLNMLNGTTQKARMAYNSSLDALVFSFA